MSADNNRDRSRRASLASARRALSRLPASSEPLPPSPADGRPLVAAAVRDAGGPTHFQGTSAASPPSASAAVQHAGGTRSARATLCFSPHELCTSHRKPPPRTVADEAAAAADAPAAEDIGASSSPPPRDGAARAACWSRLALSRAAHAAQSHGGRGTAAPGAPSSLDRGRTFARFGGAAPTPSPPAAAPPPGGAAPAPSSVGTSAFLTILGGGRKSARAACDRPSAPPTSVAMR